MGYLRTCLFMGLVASGLMMSCAKHSDVEKLGELPANIVNVVRSQTINGCRIGLVIRTISDHRVTVDGQPGPAYDGILEGSLVFSADGKRVAYAAKKGAKWLVVIDGQPGPEYDDISCGPVFRKDSLLEYLPVKGNFLYRVTK